MASSQCCSNPPTLNPSSGTGHVENLGGLNAYVTGSPHSNLAVLLVSDIHGFEAPKLRYDDFSLSDIDSGSSVTLAA